MLAIARALMGRPKLLMLDEPSLGLAPLIVKQIFATLAELNAQGMTIFLVEQNAFHALKLAHRAYVMVNGVITMAGGGRELLARPRSAKPISKAGGIDARRFSRVARLRFAPGRGITPFVLLTLARRRRRGLANWASRGRGLDAGLARVSYVAIIAAAVRFLHYALFGATLLSPQSFLVDFALLAVIALLAYRIRRARQMTEQYAWIFERSGPLTWRDRP